METFSALLALCAGNSPVPGDFPPQRPVTRSFDVFFDLHMNKRLSKQWWGWWFETQSRSLWRQSNVIMMCIAPRFTNVQRCITHGGCSKLTPISIEPYVRANCCIHDTYCHLFAKFYSNYVTYVDLVSESDLNFTYHKYVTIQVLTVRVE